MYNVGFFLRACDDVYEVIRQHLPADCQLITLHGDRPDEEFHAIRDLDFLISVRLTERMLGNAPKLKLLQLPGVGYDQVDLEAATRAGVPVAVSLAGSSEAVAEHTFALMFAVMRRVVELSNATKNGKWLMWERRVQSFGLFGRTLGIVGLGRTGMEVARRAVAFGMEVQCCDTAEVQGVRRVAFSELLATSDVVSLHVPLTPETKHMIGAEELALMKRGAVLVNTARGGLVDERALYEALISGHLIGAGLDVFEQEPPRPDHPLLTLDQVVATPHVATGTLDSLCAKAAMYSENIQRVLRGEDPVGLLRALATA